jgi:hypothetical protein
MRRHLEPDNQTVSIVWRKSGTLLLLGTLQNALAAAENSFPGFDVTHIISCGSSRSANLVQRRIDSLGSRDVTFHKCLMQDRFRCEDEFDIRTNQSMMYAIAIILAALDNHPVKCSPTKSRAVLVHCDMGINRSPTLVLASMVQANVCLREAYNLVLQARSVDPLPTYRRALEDFERQLTGQSTVSILDVFAMHFSELMQAEDDVEKVFKHREASVAQLAAEFASD